MRNGVPFLVGPTALAEPFFGLLPLLESLAPAQSEGDLNGVGTGMSILDVTEAMVTLVEGCLLSVVWLESTFSEFLG